MRKGQTGLAWDKNGHWKGGEYINDAGYKMVYRPWHYRAGQNGYVREHIILAEKVLGRALPKGVQVHHFGKPSDNTKIAICENQEYHRLLHMRQRALLGCGNPSWRKCKFCQEYDSQDNLHIAKVINGGGWNIYHPLCSAEYDRNRKSRKRIKHV